MKKLSKIALGTWSWGTGAAGGDQVFGNNLSQAQLEPVFKAAVQAGLNLWDTAAVYGMGSSESILGGLMRNEPRESLVLSTKFTPQIAGHSSKPVEEMLNGSFDRLHTDYIDLYWIHNPADVSKWTPELIPLLQSGKIKSVGVSNHDLAQIKQANAILGEAGYSVSAVQNHYSLLYRSSEQAGILDYCLQHGITFFAYMVLEQGALTGKYNRHNPLPEGSGRASSYNGSLPQLEDLIKAMQEVGSSKNASVAQIAIAWAIAKRTLPIIGVTKIAQVQEAAGAINIRLTDQEIERLEALAAATGVDTRGAWEQSMI